MTKSCHIEICLNGDWQHVASLDLRGEPTAGHARTPTHFSYDVDYAFEHLECNDSLALSVRLPVDLADHYSPTWPPFLLDLLPTGAGRIRLCQRLGLPTGASADWELLRRTGGPPPGNLRIASSQEASDVLHPGFARQEVVARGESFIDFCLQSGYPVGGSSAVQGESPKVLLSEDIRGRFHPSGSLPEGEVKAEWLVKFPRGRTETDRQILRAESVYYDIAHRFGCHTGAPLKWEGDCLFVPRFDVWPVAGKLHRFGLETMASALGKTTFGERVYLEEYVSAIRQFSTSPQDDLLELFRRDILNVALGNTDNHSRNTSFLKGENSIRLSPLYDFAPMMVDPEWIARACHWQQHEAGYPAWRQLARTLAGTREEEDMLQAELTRLMGVVPDLPEWLRAENIGNLILQRCEERCQRVMEKLI